jgi:hypothetical protein
MLKSASEEQIMETIHISFCSSVFKSGVVSGEDAELSGHPTKAQLMKMLSKGTCPQKLKY